MAVEGPLDWEIKRLFEIAERNDFDLDEVNPSDQEDFDKFFKSLTLFALRIGYFAVPNSDVVTRVWDNLYKALPGYLDSLSEKETIWTVLSRVSLLQRVRRRPATREQARQKEWASPSGFLFVELRQRLNKSKWSAKTNDGKGAATVGPKYEGLLFTKEFPEKPCDFESLTDKQKRDMKLCGAGCDVLLLRELDFKPSLVSVMFGESADSYPFRHCPGRCAKSSSQALNANTLSA